ncbi:acylphosphatase [Microbacterium sp. CIAB417]|uniref:acylphosphatase n=1 Tax=Microbacterium sp. CIAB417 TaxID=2860287 RepID=UPI001FACE7F2|nr:acylphosphatase [Microbacterium sp. CIAB417]
MTSVQVSVTGRVQGVGYRWFVQDLASEHGLTGWVRNRRDGSVEAELHGDRVDVEAVVGAMRAGPRHARVDAVQVRELTARRGLDGFEIRATE